MTRALRGVAFMIAASALVAVTTVIAKVLGTGEQALSPFQITWGRYAFAMTALGIVAIAMRPRLQRFHVPLHLARVFFGVTGVSALFASATLIPLADATAISFLNPVLAMIFAVFFLAERVGPRRWTAAAIAFAGAILLIRPGTSAFQPAALVALLAALLIGIEVILVKVLSGREPVFQILLASNVVGTLFASAVVILVWSAPTAAQWGLMVILGVTMLSAQALYVTALGSGETSFVVPFTYSTLLFAGAYDAALFGVLPTWMSLAGALLILASGVWLAIREGRGALSEPPVRSGPVD